MPLTPPDRYYLFGEFVCSCNIITLFECVNYNYSTYKKRDKKSKLHDVFTVI